MSFITIGLPNYCSPIAWLAMESLCRQITTHEWELIIYEDSDKPLGALFYSGYQERLELSGCKRIVYKYSKERVALNQKWLWMGRNSHPESVGLILQASDCYSDPYRIETAYNALASGYNWVQNNKGYFHNFETGQTMLYNSGYPTGLNMAIGMKELRSIPDSDDRWSGVDYWLLSNIVRQRRYVDSSDKWRLGVDTDGYSRISLSRKKQYDNPQPPFCRTSTELNEILPADLIKTLSTYEHKF